MATKLLARLVETAWRAPYDQRASTQVFADLNVDQIAEEMALESLGRERGENDDPASASAQLDDVESKIVERIEAEKKAGHHLFEDQLRTYAERLASLDFEGRFSEIRSVVPACVGEFRAEVAKGKDELFRLAERLRASHDQRSSFRKAHGIVRTARVHAPTHVFLKYAVLVFLMVFETVTNGLFLSKGSEQGIVGGVTEAIAFAALNIGGTLVITLWGIVQLNHARLWRRLVGITALLAYVAFAVGLNLALAHYREVSAAFTDGGGEKVLAIMLDTPLEFHDVNSWIFFGIGILFSLFALLDGLSLRDPYPGFHHVEHQFRSDEAAYLNTRKELIEELQAVRDEYREDMDEVSRDLSIRRGEHDAIVANRARLLVLFDAHQAQLERAGNTLFSNYREANRKVRKTKPPKRFSMPFKLERISVSLSSSSDMNTEELRIRIVAIQEVLAGEVQSIHRTFEEELKSYPTLEDILRDTRSGHGETAS